MDNSTKLKEFDRSIRNVFNVYNSLFLSLPFRQIRHTGVLIPLLQSACVNGLRDGREPLEILNAFFDSQAGIQSEDEKIDFMFRVIQYVERQIVLFDSVEDAAFATLLGIDEPLSLRDYAHMTDEKSITARLSEHLATFRTRIVFTAHPTQFYPPSVLKIIARLRKYISDNAISSIDLILQQLGLTSLTKSKSPTPLEEAQNIIYFLRYVYYDAVGELYEDLKKVVRDQDFNNPEIIQLGFWPGGDRDGNPYVTAETTMDVADELRMTLMKCYYQDLKDLENKLTFRGVEDDIAHLTSIVYQAMFDRDALLSYGAIEAPLRNIKQQLVADYNGLYVEDVDAFLDKIAIFRTHFAAIDIRQNHRIHERVVSAILIDGGLIKESLDELDRDELISILTSESMSPDSDRFDDALIRDTLLTIRQIPEIQKRNGEAGCNRYVISNSEDIFSVLFVFALFRWCLGSEHFPIDIIPLFESVEGMDHAGAIMQALYDIPAYRDHVRRRGETQTMMLGFSDGTKDGGYLRANWSIHETKEVLTAVCDRNGVRAIFFDGRGGPPARGGGKTHRFYASQSGLIANHAIEMTIQGQVITSMYGTKDHFKHNCEQLIAAGVHKNVFENENVISEASRTLFEEVAQLSYEKYAALKSDPMFIPYLENKSTLRYYSKANIGSRPSVRGNDEKLELRNLRAIPFVGSWSQLKQNVPGYFGVGTAFKSIVDDGRLTNLQNLFRDVPFFKTLVLNCMMSLTKCSFELTHYISRDPEYGPFWRMLLAEFELSKEMVLLISGYTELMEEEPVSRKSIAIREDIVVPLLVIQQYALQKIEEGSELKPIYEKIVTRSLYGNINASRNSA